MLARHIEVSCERGKEKSFLKYFSAENKFYFVYDVKVLLNVFDCKYARMKIFTDSSKATLNCSLLSNCNK